MTDGTIAIAPGGAIMAIPGAGPTGIGRTGTTHTGTTHTGTGRTGTGPIGGRISTGEFPTPVSSPGRGGGATGATTIIAMTGATATGFRATAMSAAVVDSRSSCHCSIRRAITGSGPDPVRRLQPRFRARALRASRLSVSTPSAKAIAKYR